MSSGRRQVVVFSGGSAANSLVDVFNGLLSPKTATTDATTNNHTHDGSGESTRRKRLSYIIGISDNGGSTSEVLRVFGGPGIGDVRSRLIRLVPDNAGDGERELAERAAIKQLMNYRLPASNSEARIEWLGFVEGTHDHWKKIPSEKRELIRSFFIFLNAEIVKRARPPTSTFNFHSASIGNLFLTGARIFFGSFESAIYLFRSITGVPEHTQVIPTINSNFAHHIAAGLVDGTMIVGQNQISHPSDSSAASLMPSSENIYSTVPSGVNTPMPFPISGLRIASPQLGWPESQYQLQAKFPHHYDSNNSNTEDEDDEENDGVEDANLPGSHPSLRTQNIVFEKENEPELPSRIDRIWYINPYGQEIRPPANPKVVAAINEAEAVVYSIGSLYTSIIPCLILRGIGHAISSPAIKSKILILNGSLDRETGPIDAHNPAANFSASDFVRAIARACVDSQSRKVPTPVLTSNNNPMLASSRFPTSVSAFVPPSEYVKYVTHVVYLVGEGAPRVDTKELGRWGVRCVRVKEKEVVDESGSGGRGIRRKVLYYEEEALGQALASILAE
ncbi:hypothetical protein DFH27DRAFT_530657 [Peziza echinospora]|nr:hypothetical protein DFH27DRAFT_530657 [Peziza echinospora]